MSPKRKREFTFLILSGIFIANAIIGELIGGKLIRLGGAVFSLGVIPWPIVFVTTDLINEYFGRDGVRNLSLFTAGLIGYAFVMLYLGMHIPAVDFSPVTDAAFNNVFGQSLWIIVGSLIAFLVSQMVDVGVFWMVRARTDGRMLWLRSTGSTVVSQLFDSFIVAGIAFYLPGVFGLVAPDQRLTLGQFVLMASSNYGYKIVIAIGMTPVIYLAHGAIERALGHRGSEELIEEAVRTSL